MSKKSARILAIVTAVVALLASASVWSATPSEGTITAPSDNKLGKRAALTYTGGAVVGVAPVAEAEDAFCAGPVQSPAQCDQYMLHFAMPSNWYAERIGKVTSRLVFKVDWSDAPNTTATDMDLLVYDSSGAQVASGTTDNTSSGSPAETAILDAPLGGDYRVIFAGSLGSVPSYKGTITLELLKADPINTIRDTSIRFGPASVVDPSIFGGEPAVTTDRSKSSAWWIDWPIGSRSNTGTLHRSFDGGDTFRLVTNSRCPVRRKPGCATAGGGDTMTAVSKGGVVYWADQEALANEAVNVSTDHGMTWPMERENAISSLDVENDRQWLATYGDETAWISASVATGTGLARTDDGGKTWQALTPVVGDVDGASAPMVVDETGGPNDGTLYMLGRNLEIAVSRDKGDSFTQYPTTDLPNTGPAAGSGGSPLGTPPPWMSIDSAGNLYVVWTEESDGIVRMSTMLASAPQNKGAKLGSTWSKPVKVSIPPATSTIFTQVAAGDPGRVVITYEGAEPNAGPSNMPAGTPWFIYSAFTTDGLCQWSKTCPIGPAFLQTRVSDRANHIGNICTDGTLCAADPSADRNLADFFDLDVDRDGRAGITWTDDNHGVPFDATTTRGGYIMFSKVATGPSLRARGAAYARSATASLTSTGARVLARSGDAMWPINEPGGLNYPTLDLLGESVASTKDSLNITMDLASTKDLSQGLGAGSFGQHVKYLVRWNYGRDTYFVIADTTGSAPTFYGGKIDVNDEMVRTAGTSIYGTTYAPDFDVTGTVTDGRITFTVPFSAVGGLRPGARLYSMQSFTLVGLPDSVQTLYTAPDTIDATPPLDYTVGATAVLGSKVTKPTPVSGKPAPKPRGRHLPATGVGGETTGVLLVAAAAALWVLRSRRGAADRI